MNFRSCRGRACSSTTRFRRLPPKWGFQWKFFFEMPGEREPGAAPRISYRIDASLTNPLSRLPFVATPDVRSLAERNLLRGRSMGLPSGQSVSQAMGIPPLSDRSSAWRVSRTSPGTTRCGTTS